MYVILKFGKTAVWKKRNGGVARIFGRDQISISSRWNQIIVFSLESNKSHFFYNIYEIDNSVKRSCTIFEFRNRWTSNTPGRLL